MWTYPQNHGHVHDSRDWLFSFPNSTFDIFQMSYAASNSLNAAALGVKLTEESLIFSCLACRPRQVDDVSGSIFHHPVGHGPA